jgi:hypothetical protein
MIKEELLEIYSGMIGSLYYYRYDERILLLKGQRCPSVDQGAKYLERKKILKKELVDKGTKYSITPYGRNVLSSFTNGQNITIFQKNLVRDIVEVIEEKPESDFLKEKRDFFIHLIEPNY